MDASPFFASKLSSALQADFAYAVYGSEIQGTALLVGWLCFAPEFCINLGKSFLNWVTLGLGNTPESTNFCLDGCCDSFVRIHRNRLFSLLFSNAICPTGM
jgi:hypothetical protein